MALPKFFFREITACQINIAQKISWKRCNRSVFKNWIVNTETVIFKEFLQKSLCIKHRFSCHSDFTWNKLLQSWIKQCSTFWKFLTISNVVFYQKSKFGPPKWWKLQIFSFWNCQIRFYFWKIDESTNTYLHISFYFQITQGLWHNHYYFVQDVLKQQICCRGSWWTRTSPSATWGTTTRCLSRGSWNTTTIPSHSAPLGRRPPSRGSWSTWPSPPTPWGTRRPSSYKKIMR